MNPRVKAYLPNANLFQILMFTFLVFDKFVRSNL